jgi:hypothetical protein
MPASRAGSVRANAWAMALHFDGLPNESDPLLGTRLATTGARRWLSTARQNPTAHHRAPQFEPCSGRLLLRHPRFSRDRPDGPDMTERQPTGPLRTRAHDRTSSRDVLALVHLERR